MKYRHVLLTVAGIALATATVFAGLAIESQYLQIKNLQKDISNENSQINQMQTGIQNIQGIVLNESQLASQSSPSSPNYKCTGTFMQNNTFVEGVTLICTPITQ